MVTNLEMTIEFTTFDDPDVEGPEFFTFSIQPPSGIDLVDNGPFTVDIGDNDCE